ncbi:MAG TPA: glutamate mutase L [Mycobacterium sp.]
MRAIVLADFGSTFTKVTVVQESTGRLLATAQSPTTITTDVMDGYETALAVSIDSIGQPVEIAEKLAASSAGGGLRLAAIGLVPDYTAAAAKQAALNAGAKIELLLSGRLSANDVSSLERVKPEILLFSGGTDGGQRDQVLDNAAAIASARFDCHIVVSCNREIASEVAALLRVQHGSVEIVENVLPAIRTLNIEPARRAVHEAFIRHVIRGKGLSQTNEFGSTVIMPTPEAVLEATQLLARGDGTRPGLGDVITVDIGGATTDIHSAVALRALAAGIRSAGLPSLPLTRTVEGDLGMRWSALGVLDADSEWLRHQCSDMNLDGNVIQNACQRRHDHPDFLPESEREAKLDRLLAMSCITQALHRHCGTFSTIYIPGQGTEFVQEGTDMTEVPLLVGTGGMLVRDPLGVDTLQAAVRRRKNRSLTPKSPTAVLDRNYILAAAGLLSTRDKKAAYTLLREQIQES